MRKYHIINLPYSTLKGLFPPLHSLVGVTAVDVDMSNLKFRYKNIGWQTKKVHYPQLFLQLTYPMIKDEQIYPDHPYKMPVG